MFCGLTAVEFQLADEGPGDGGLAVIPGSHKANFPLPEKLSLYEEHREYVKEVHSQAGDAIIFTEALTHGTLVWQGEHQRRSLIYKYSPSFQAHAPGYHQTQISRLHSRHERRRTRHAQLEAPNRFIPLFR